MPIRPKSSGVVSRAKPKLHALTLASDVEVKALQPGAKAIRYSLGDGLHLTVDPKGNKRWALRYRYAGKESMVGLGSYPRVTLKDARRKAAEARTLLMAGKNPSEEKRAARFALRHAAANTFGNAAEAWVTHNTPRWRPATLEKVRQYLDKDLLPPLAKRPLDNITPPELAAVIERIEKRKALNVAKKSRQWIKKIFQFAIAKGMTANNPAEFLADVAEHAPESTNHAHVTGKAELRKLVQAIHAYTGNEITKGCALLSLWTANRPGVTRTLRWDEIDLDKALWSIPKGRDLMKRGYAHATPLPKQAVAMLRELHEITGTYEYVFVGRNDPSQPISDGTVAGMLKKLQFGGKQTPHGFRHLVSTALNERGYNPDWIERQLAHGDPDAIRDTYNKAQYLPQRTEMMQEWADELDRIRNEPGE